MASLHGQFIVANRTSATWKIRHSYLVYRLLFPENSVLLSVHLLHVRYYSNQIRPLLGVFLLDTEP